MIHPKEPEQHSIVFQHLCYQNTCFYFLTVPLRINNCRTDKQKLTHSTETAQLHKMPKLTHTATLFGSLAILKAACDKIAYEVSVIQILVLLYHQYCEYNYEVSLIS